MEGEKQNEVVGMLHTLIPEYAQYHWRRLHKTVQDASYEDYKQEDFYSAVFETIKRYEHIVQIKSGDNRDGQKLMLAIFGKDNSVLSVASKYKRRDGTDFSASTIENIEEGQKYMSAGVMAGARNTRLPILFAKPL